MKGRILFPRTPQERTAVRSESECTMIVRESGDALAEEQVIYGLARIISTRSIVLKFIKSVLLLLLLFGAVVNAEQISLKNGDRLTGTIVSMDGKKLVLKTTYAGDVSINWDSVEQF